MSITADEARQIAQQVAQVQTELNNQRAQIHAQNQQLQAQSQQLHAAQQQIVAGGAAVAGRRLKPVAPVTFSGVVGENANLFLAGLNAYFSAVGAADATRTGFAIAQLRGNALRWVTATPRYTADPNNFPYDQFCVEFLGQFNPINDSNQARADLLRIREDTRSPNGINNLIGNYQSLMTRISDMAEADRINFFINALRTSLRVEVIKAKSPTATLAEVMSLAVRIDAAYRSAFHHPRTNMHSGNRFQHNYNSSSSSAAHSSSNMDIDNSINEVDYSGDDEDNANNVNNVSTFRPNRNNFNRSNNNRRVPGLSRDEYDRCMKTNLCFQCKGTGHLARNCPKKNNNNSSKNGKDQRQH
jgi:hypothetical protein